MCVQGKRKTINLVWILCTKKLIYYMKKCFYTWLCMNAECMCWLPILLMKGSFLMFTCIIMCNNLQMEIPPFPVKYAILCRCVTEAIYCHYTGVSSSFCDGCHDITLPPLLHLFSLQIYQEVSHVLRAVMLDCII